MDYLEPVKLIDARFQAKRAINVKIERVLGHPMVGLDDILSILTSPDVLPLLENYVEATKKLDTFASRLD